jgi:histidinol-phosphate aminotransferase
MSVSRRGFLQGLRSGDAKPATAFMAARGHEEYVAELMQQGRYPASRPQLPPGVEAIRISSNENPLGPGKAAIDAILGKFPEANRYPFNSTPLDADLEILIAKLNNARRENVVLGVGSQEILRNAVRVFMSSSKHLAQATPTFENCGGVARQLGYPVKGAPVDAKMKTDLAALLPLARGAGLVYICNPNNPTSTIVGSKELTDFVNEVRKSSPTTTILIDEAYYDYITDPSYTTLIPLALQTPNVIVARTFSKAYGMAGVRIGYAIGDSSTIKRMSAYRMPYNVNTFGVAAAVASLKDPKHIEEERARNTAVRDFTVKALADMGYESADSQANFLFTNIGKTMTAAAFREGCAKQGVLVGRDFPPLEKQWARISLGTMEEMQKATQVFRNVLRPAATTWSGKGR